MGATSTRRPPRERIPGAGIEEALRCGKPPPPRLATLLLGGLLAASPAAAQPVTLINVFEVPPAALAETVRRWEVARDFLARQPGYVSTRLHQSLTPDARFALVNIAVWDSPEAFRAASTRMAAELPNPMPEGVRFTPGLYRVIRE